MSEPARGPAEGTGTEEERDDFETALRELEMIVSRLDRDDVDLDEAMALFERGIARLRRADRLLEEAKGRVEELITESSGASHAAALDDPPPEGEDEGP